MRNSVTALVLGAAAFAVLAVWMISSPMEAQHQLTTTELDAFGYELLSPGAVTALGATAATAANARAMVCTLEGTVSVRYRYDGTAPTTTEGHLSGLPTATVPVPLVILGRNNVNRFRVIASSGSGVLRCTYLR